MSDPNNPCVFCDPTLIKAPAVEYASALGYSLRVFQPLFPVTAGHVLVVPTLHVPHAAADPMVAAAAMMVAAEHATVHEAANILTSIGRPATQSVDHLHLHVVPRHPGDGLALPWDSGSPRIVDPPRRSPVARQYGPDQA